MYNHILQNRVSRVQSVEMREGRGQTFWDGTQSGTHRVKQTSAVKEAKRVHWSRKINRLSMQRSLSQSCCNKHFFCPANQSIKLSTQSKQSQSWADADTSNFELPNSMCKQLGKSRVIEPLPSSRDCCKTANRAVQTKTVQSRLIQGCWHVSLTPHAATRFKSNANF